MVRGDWRSRAAVALLAGVGVAGCGGSGDETETRRSQPQRPPQAQKARPGPLVVYRARYRGAPAYLRIEKDGRTFVRGRIPKGDCPAKPRHFKMSGGEISSVDAQLARVPRTKQRTGVGDHPRALEFRLEASGAKFHYRGLHSVPKVILPLIVKLDSVIGFRCGGQ